MRRPSPPRVACYLVWGGSFRVSAQDGCAEEDLQDALAAEIMEAYQGQGNAIRKRDEVHKMAQANKAFAHYAW